MADYSDHRYPKTPNPVSDFVSERKLTLGMGSTTWMLPIHTLDNHRAVFTAEGDNTVAVTMTRDQWKAMGSPYAIRMEVGGVA